MPIFIVWFVHKNITSVILRIKTVLLSAHFLDTLSHVLAIVKFEIIIIRAKIDRIVFLKKTRSFYGLTITTF